MGCGGSKPAVRAPVAAAPAVTAKPILLGADSKILIAPPAGKKPRKESKFQITLSGQWEDYDKQEDMVLKRAYLVGQPNARFSLRGQQYEYNFKKMIQKNLGTKKVREIRPPYGMTAPKQALLPKGSMVVLTVKKGQAGQTIEIDDPNNKGQKIAVNVPAGARAGQKMAVPVPEKGQSIEEVCRKQQGWSTGAKTAAGLAAVGTVGAAAVGGALVGDHLAGGTMAADGLAAAATHWHLRLPQVFDVQRRRDDLRGRHSESSAGAALAKLHPGPPKDLCFGLAAFRRSAIRSLSTLRSIR